MVMAVGVCAFWSETTRSDDAGAVVKTDVSKSDGKAVIPLAEGLTPAEAAARMTVPDGFHVTLAAGEPQVHQPVAMTIDSRGRVWIAEAYTYPVRAPEGQGRDRIQILEDTNGDGTLDQVKTFAEGLNLVSGLEVGFGGVWIGAAPYLLFIPDADQDDQPDGPPQTLLDGFGYGDTHETLNAFNWGPDGWLYGCQGVFTHSRVGKPGSADADRVPVNAGVWRYHPQRHQFEVFAWGTSNPWGVDFDDHGQAFITACVIPHLYHVIQGARYQRQAGQHFNPYVFEDIPTIADHLHYAGDIRDHAWWGQDFVGVNDATSIAGGGHAHCGCMIYLGDNWPDAYRNTLLVCNVHGNRVNREVLEREGSGFVGKHGPDFLMSHDHWFRGINLRYGPDGSVYMIDWYDKNACHRTNTEIWDRTNGRVYNVHYGERKPVRVNLDAMTDAELVQLQLHKNDWFVRTARRILQHRGGNQQVHKLLWEMFDREPDVTRKLRALWTLHATQGIPSAKWNSLLGHAEESVRAWAIQLMVESESNLQPWIGTFQKLAGEDPSARVRLYLASAMQRVPTEQRWEVVKGLLAHSEDVDDHNLPLLVWYATEPLVAANAERAMELLEVSKMPKVTRFIVRRASTEVDQLNPVMELLGKQQDDATRQWMLDEIINALSGQADLKVPSSWPAVYKKLVTSQSESVREAADRVAVALGDRAIFPRMRQIAVDSSVAMPKRRKALEVLVEGRDVEAQEVMISLLEEPALRGTAVKALASFDGPQVSDALIKAYGNLTVEEKRDAIHTLCARANSAASLFDAIADGKIPRGDVHAYDIRQIVGVADAKLRERIESVWGTLRDSDEERKQMMVKLKAELEKASHDNVDVGRGRALFDKTCANCHKLFAQGGDVGPELTGSNRANIDYILENVLDPSAVLGKDYRLTMLELDDGRVVSGLVKGETASALTVRTVNETIVVPKSQIEDRTLVEKSMMPDGLLDTMKFEEIQDLVAYLGSPVQIEPKGPAAPIDPSTGRVADALEGESLKILTKSDGAADKQGMGAFPGEKWSGASQLWWTGGKPGAKLELAVPVETSGNKTLECVLTKARDYGVVQLAWDGAALGGPLDMFDAKRVTTTGVLSFPLGEVAAGDHTLTVEIIGANPQAVRAYMFGLDYVRVQETEETPDAAAAASE
jgi:putative membrane-bound dehydrogenase-like protein